MIRSMLRSIFVKCLDSKRIPKKKFYVYTRDENDCECCPIAIQKEGRDCTCKIEEIETLDDGTELKWKHRQECTDWDCSYCH